MFWISIFDLCEDHIREADAFDYFVTNFALVWVNGQCAEESSSIAVPSCLIT
jgi:hypothetical protein